MVGRWPESKEKTRNSRENGSQITKEEPQTTTKKPRKPHRETVARVQRSTRIVRPQPQDTRRQTPQQRYRQTHQKQRPRAEAIEADRHPRFQVFGLCSLAHRLQSRPIRGLQHRRGLPTQSGDMSVSYHRRHSRWPHTPCTSFDTVPGEAETRNARIE